MASESNDITTQPYKLNRDEFRLILAFLWIITIEKKSAILEWPKEYIQHVGKRYCRKRRCFQYGN